MIHRYRFISEHHATYGITRLCRVLAVPRRQGYYEWLAAQPARQERAEAEDQLAAEIRAVHSEHRGAYGSPRVAAELRRRGRRVNRKRVERIMRERGIVGHARRRRVTSIPVHTADSFPCQPDRFGGSTKLGVSGREREIAIVPACAAIASTTRGSAARSC